MHSYSSKKNNPLFLFGQTGAGFIALLQDLSEFTANRGINIIIRGFLAEEIEPPPTSLHVNVRSRLEQGG